jgi:glutathione S-transferase
MAITLYQFEISPFCDKVRRILNVKNVPYTCVDPRLNELSAFKKKSPAGRLPVLDHDGRIVTDSTDIAHYLEAAFPNPALVPTDPRHAAEAAILEDWADESLYFFELTMRLTWETNAPRIVGQMMEKANAPKWMARFAPGQVMATYGKVARAQGLGAKPRPHLLADLERNLDAVVNWLVGKEWLVADTMTLADISVAVQLFCIEGTVEGGPLVSARPELVAWLRRTEAASAPSQQ